MDSIVTNADWLRCKPYIQAALDQGNGFETIADVEQMIDAGTYMFWPGAKSAAVTEFSHFRQRKVLTVVHGGGDLSELTDLIEPILADYAKRTGCDGIMGTGRRGWERVFERRGYRLAWIVMLKDLPA